MKDSIEIIAEIGWNHMGDKDLAYEMISSAKQAGADTVKFQYWNPEFLKPGPWDTDGRREIYNKAALDEKKVMELKLISQDIGCKFLISVFGTIGAKVIADLGIQDIKIPSHETTNLALINFCKENFEHIYFSAGASLESEVIAANDILKNGDAKYTLMHCVSSYPCADEKANLPRLNWLKGLHENIGFSDHTGSTIVPPLSVAHGATVIEKHFTTDKELPGRDNKFALDTSEFNEMCINIRNAEKALIDHGLDYQDIEKDTVQNYRGRWEPQDYS
jgi:N,N'-diacetyllegionaminate synthase